MVNFSSCTNDPSWISRIHFTYEIFSDFFRTYFYFVPLWEKRGISDRINRRRKKCRFGCSIGRTNEDVSFGDVTLSRRLTKNHNNSTTNFRRDRTVVTSARPVRKTFLSGCFSRRLPLRLESLRFH